MTDTGYLPCGYVKWPTKRMSEADVRARMAAAPDLVGVPMIWCELSCGGALFYPARADGVGIATPYIDGACRPFSYVCQGRPGCVDNGRPGSAAMPDYVIGCDPACVTSAVSLYRVMPDGRLEFVRSVPDKALLIVERAERGFGSREC